MKRLRLMAMVLTVAMVVTLMTGCAGASKKEQVKTATTDAKIPEYLNMTGMPIAKQPITLKVFGSGSANQVDWNTMKVLTQYEKMTNMSVKYDIIEAHAYPEKKNILFASRDLPDFFLRAKFTSADQVNFGTQGILAPLNELIDQYAPNLKALLAKYPDVKKDITAPDGKIYSLPVIRPTPAEKYGVKLYINKTWLDKLSIKVPTTTEEYYQALKAFKEKDPNGNGKADELGWTGDSSVKIIQFLHGAWGLNNAGSTASDIGSITVDKDPAAPGKLRLICTAPYYKEVLEYCNKLYKEGLIDNEVFTVKSASVQNPAKAKDGVLGSFIATADLDSITDNGGDNFVIIPALKGPHGEQMYTNVNTVGYAGVFAISANSKYPEAIMRWVDYLYGEEGSKLIQMGIEGETCKTMPDGKVVYTDLVKKNPQGLDVGTVMGGYTPMNAGQMPTLTSEKFQDLTPEFQDALKQLDKYAVKEVIPFFLHEPKAQDSINTLEPEIINYYKEMRAKFVTGKEPLTKWDEYVSTIKKMGSDELVKYYSDAYEKWKNSK